MKRLSILLIIIGVARGLFELWLDAGMRQITDWEYSASITGWLLSLSDWTLIFGPILVMTGWLPKVGSVVALTGCIVFTGEAIYGLSGVFNVPFSQGRPLYVVLSMIVLIALFADVAAFWLARLVWSHQNHLTKRCSQPLSD
jgi:hypothetical protein